MSGILKDSKLDRLSQKESTYRSMFNSCKGFLGRDLLTLFKLSRRLTGMREEPGILAVIAAIEHGTAAK